MPKILFMPTPQRACLAIIFTRTGSLRYTLEIVNAFSGESIGAVRDLDLSELARKLESLKLPLRVVRKTVDAMLGGEESSMLPINLSEAQISQFLRKH